MKRRVERDERLAAVLRSELVAKRDGKPLQRGHRDEFRGIGLVRRVVELGEYPCDVPALVPAFDAFEHVPGPCRAFFDHAALSASGAPPTRHVAAQLYGDRDGAGPFQIGFRPLAAEDAAAWLKSLVRELLGRPHAYLLPIEAVLRLAHGLAEHHATVDDLRALIAELVRMRDTEVSFQG